MPSRTRSYRMWLWSAALVALSAAPAAAQPPSPLDLVRGLREYGQVDLALEYLKELESKPLSPDDKAAIPLERAKCLLEASEDEPDEGTRLGLVAEAKEGLNDFLIKHPKHPRAVEALLTVAKLAALDAKEQLNRARRVEIPPPSEVPAESAARERAQDKQKAEAEKARPLFLLASKQFNEASGRIRARLDDKTLDPNTRRALEREAFEAELAGGINQFNTAETYMPVSRVTGAEKAERNKLLEQSKQTFGKLANGPPTNRTVWVARAWAAEVTFEQDDFNTAAAEVGAVLKAAVPEAEDGKRLARFFHLRRNYFAALGEKDRQKAVASEKELRDWLGVYGNPRKPTPEVFAVRYYLARVLQSLAESSITPPKGGGPVVVGAAARAQLAEAEKLYRVLAQSDHDFTVRASRQRMAVVRRLLGEADQPVASYTTFETAQMASLIQMSKLAAEEAKAPVDEQKVKGFRLAAIALLERARELATPADNPADVTDVLMRLIYFYQLTDQPYQAAVLGEHVAHTIKSTGGKAALAGLLGLNGYVVASTRVKGDDPETVAAARRTDRARAVALARFLDEKHPNDNATDSARYRLASMLTEEKRYPDAFEVIVRVRPGFPQITNVRLLEGYLAAQIVNAKGEDGKEPPVPAAKKADVFKRAVADLAKVVKPPHTAPPDEVHGYLSARCRMASLLFAQGRADPAAEAAEPGYNQALVIAEEVIGLVPGFDAMVTAEGGMKKLNLDGLELTMIARDAYSRAVYLRARALISAGEKLPPEEQKQKFAEAEKALAPVLESAKTGGPLFAGPIKNWFDGRGDLLDPSKPDGEANRDPAPVAVHKARVAQLAAAVDKTRVEVILAGFRLKVKDSKPAEAADLLDLMTTFGGTIEENLPVLEVLGREMAARMLGLQKEGKAQEAAELGTGLAVLLKKIKAVPKLSSAQLLFIGQMLLAIKEYPEALESLRKVPEPEFKEWKTTAPEKVKEKLQVLKKGIAAIEDEVIKTLPAEDQTTAKGDDRQKVVTEKVVPALKGKDKKGKEKAVYADYMALIKERDELEKTLLPRVIEERFPSQMRDYSAAQLSVARALRGAEKFAEAEALLLSIIGTNDKRGWGFGRLYFRRELATVYEAKGGAATDAKTANAEWSKALKEWTTLFTLQRNNLQTPPKDATPTQLTQYRNAFADAFFDVQRCLVRANEKLLNPQVPVQAAKLQKTYEDTGKKFVDMEKQIPAGEWEPEVQHRYADFLKDVPQVMAAYKAAGGKAFLEKLPLP